MRPRDVIGLIRGSPDIHSLGIAGAASLLRDCGLQVHIADQPVFEATGHLHETGAQDAVEHWIRSHRLSVVGLSYRLDPDDAVAHMERFCAFLRRRHLLADRGPLRELYFAGLPDSCRRVRERFPEVTGVFAGGETPQETLSILGLDTKLLPPVLQAGTAYDVARWNFARELIGSGLHHRFVPEDRSRYPEFGTEADTLPLRLVCVERGQLPLMRSHVGPSGSPREQVVAQFLDWCRQLGQDRLLDILSIGSSQRTQDDFFGDWTGRPNGGGVPLQGEAEMAAVWRAARPLLVRTYAGTKDMERLVGVYERALHAAWHTFSFWWFNRLDGRGPSELGPSLEEHFRTLGLVAAAGKPFEPNVPHHFAFRGADDVSYVVSGFLAAKAAQGAGVPLLVLQAMLNTPRATWGIQDLAKTRALVTLVRELEGPRFRVVLQPRAGLDYFRADPATARIQLAAATALMDDIEPHDTRSPGIVHVVGFSEASAIADPAVIRESIQITQTAFREYRRLRDLGQVEDMSYHEETLRRYRILLGEARAMIAAIEASVVEPYTARGFLQILRAGFFPLPDLWEGRQELTAAVGWKTAMRLGGVTAVDEAGNPLSFEQRLPSILEALRAQG